MGIIMLIYCALLFAEPPPPTGVGDPPAATNALQNIATILKTPTLTEEIGKSMVSIGAGLPPVPKSLVERIHAGEYVDMVELLPDSLGTHGSTPVKDEKSLKRSKRQITSIAEWVQCFGVFMAVVASKFPERVVDLLGYQSIIVEASREYEGDTWLGYDRRFRQMVAATPDAKWATVDPTLWNMAFTGQARIQRCKYCFSLSHQAADCEWAPNSKTPSTLNRQFRSMTPICKAWNFSSHVACDFVNCTYQHICLRCGKDTSVTDKAHKLINCPKRQPQRRPAQSAQYVPVQTGQSQPQPPQQTQPPLQPMPLIQPQQYQGFKPY